MMLPGLAARADAGDIPHENYDLMESNLDVVIALLNSSVLYSEAALDSMYYEHMAAVEDNLTIVRGILSPADRLLGEIQNIAGSYENLSALLPPFASLSSEEDSFAEMESSLLGARYQIVSAALLANLTGEELLDAMSAVNTFNSLVFGMNGTIDDMLESARRIIDLEVDGERPFTHNDLIPLIERLRDLLHSLQVEVDRIIHEDIDWGRTTPFLLLWLDSSPYHLGDVISGGGYLYYNGSFATNNLIYITKDGANYTSSITSRGYYSFQRVIPMNASWIGSHTMRAWAYTPAGILWSDPKPFEVVLAPTSIVLTLSTNLIAPDESVTAGVKLQTAQGERLGNMPCNLSVDGSMRPFETGADGTYTESWTGSHLEYGSHSFQAVFGGVLPYGPSSSAVLNVMVDIPTNVSVSLFSTRLRQDFSIVGTGYLYSNGTTPLPGKEITISVDDHMTVNLTTESDGRFAFSIPADAFRYGTHILRAEFLHRDGIWRYSHAEVSFTVLSPKQGAYPFLPHIPGWGGLSPDMIIPYLFFGTYAYITWLLLLALIGITVRIYQARKRRSEGMVLSEKSATMQAIELPAAPSPAAQPQGDGLEFGFAGEAAPMAPNERIVWYYQGLLSFLRRRQRVSLSTSMTHWEVARMLDSLGYPTPHVERATVLFEKALYSGQPMTEEDSVTMSITLTHIVGATRGGESAARTA